MTSKSPIHDLHANAGAMFTDYGVAEPHAQAGSPAIIPVVATYGELALEYTALRRACVILDLPHRGMIEVAGADAASFLNRMLTQELKDLRDDQFRRSFWLNRKGRIDADIRVLRDGSTFTLELDALAVPRTLAELSRYLVMEDCTIRDRSIDLHRFSLQGPTALILLTALGVTQNPSAGSVIRTTIADQPVTIFRDDVCCVPGFELLLPATSVARVFETLIQAGHDPHHGAEALRIHGTGTAGSQIKLRPAGWHAFNIARIEGGSPLYNLDFGPDSLPAETGIIADRVSFTKGCYLGQEVVARMHSRGHSKSTLMAVQLKETGLDRALPITGAAVRLAGQDTVIGSVTTFTYSPIMGAARIGFAMMKHDYAKPDLEITLDTETGRETAKTNATLAFIKPAS